MPDDFCRGHGLPISTPSTCWLQSEAYASRTRARPGEGIGGSDRQAAFGPKKIPRVEQAALKHRPKQLRVIGAWMMRQSTRTVLPLEANWPAFAKRGSGL